MAKSRPSIQDVARLAGVSLGTVSNVLNNPAVVRRETVEKVQRAIDQLAFVRNDAARQLKAGKSQTLGMVVYDTGNPFFAEITRAAETVAAAKNFNVLLGNSDHKLERERSYLQLFDQQRVAGVVVSPTQDIYDEIDVLRAHGTQTVVLDRKAEAERCCSVSVDDVAGGRIAVEHLLATGRRRIAFIGDLSMQQVSDRLAGANEALSAANSVSGLVMLDDAKMTVDAGRSAGEGICDLPTDQRPDAIFAANDLLALGLVQAFVLNGNIKVPHDIAIIGYDDISWAEAAVVPLSSIRQPSRLIGETAIELVLDEINHASEHKHRQVTFLPELVVRASTFDSHSQHTEDESSTNK